MNKKLFLTAMLFLASFSFALCQNYWTLSDNSAKGKEIIAKKVAVTYYDVYTLDFSSFNAALQNAPMRGEYSKGNELFLTLPNSDGQFVTYRIVEAPVLHPDLGANFPTIKSYAGQGVDDPATSIRFSVSSERGLYGMIFNGDNGVNFIDPYSVDLTEYMVYSKKDMIRTAEADFECTMPDEHNHSSEESVNPKATNDKKLRKYRLALCCNAEYGNLFIGTATTNHQKYLNILAQMNITMTRVNGVYEKDLAITMEIIPNDTLIIYFGSTTTDPWGTEFNTKTAQTIDAAIGIANYDIGHNFNTSGGGNAGCIACVCLGTATTTSQSGTHKGRGMTGRSDPTGDAFDIDYVAHEMGHQFGGYHTMNTCSRSGSGSTEVEICSGTTIMGYAGICNPNVQMNSDAYFAYVNIRDISANVKTGNSASCAQIINFTNNPPTANAGADYIIPKSTAFVLTGVGTDPDGDILTYTWEENDPALPTGSATTAPVATWAAGPMFRSLTGTTSPSRYFPVITSIIANNLAPTWEVIPSVARTLNFSLVVRDNKAGGGQTADDLMVVTVNGTAGPFTVSAPNTAVTWAAGSTQTVTWNVAGTTAAPVSCANVDIFLSTDGGYTYPITLLANTLNDGTETITIPNNPSTTCRVMVRGANNIFFDISNINFTITGSVNTITSGTITGSPFCAGVAVSVPFTMSGTFNAGNIFTAQLSNAAGSFATPVSIGTLTGITSGTIAGTIPAGTATGTGYRIRVVSSSPVATGADNGTNISINSSTTPTVVIAGTATICAGTATTFTATPTNGGTPSYQWKLNGSNVGTNSATYSNGAITNGNTVSCVMTSNAPCVSSTSATSNTITMVVNPIPATPTASASSPVCAGASINLTTPTVSGASYSWSGPNAYTSTSQNPVITNSTTIMAGSYSVSVTQAGCTSLPGSTTVAITAAPAAPLASSNSPVCLAAAINLTTPTVSGATYSWTGPNGFTSTQQNPVISSATAIMGGTYSVTVLQGTCPSTAGTTSILVNAPPVASFNGSPTATFCSGFVQFTDNSTGNPSSWSWNFGDGQTSTSQSPSHDYLASGTYTVTLSAVNNCGNNQLVNTNYITVSVPTAPTGTGASSCGSGIVNLSAAGSGTLNWYDADTGGGLVNTGTTYTTPSLTSTTTYYVESASTSYGTSQFVPCPSITAATNSTVSRYHIFTVTSALRLVSVQVRTTTAGNRTIELRNSAGTVLQTITTNIPTGTNTVTLNWNIPAGTNYQLGLSTTSTVNLFRNNSAVTYPYQIAGLVSITNNSTANSYGFFYNWEVQPVTACNSTRVPVVATINTALPASVSVVASNSSICSGTSATFTATPTNGGVTPTYQWRINGSPVGTNSPTYTNSTLVNNDIVTCIMTSNGSCVSGSPATSNSVTMTVNSALTPSVSIAGTSTICAGTSTTFTATPTNGGVPTYQWQVNGSPVGANSPSFNSSSLVNGNIVTCVMTSGLSCANPTTATSNIVTVTVNPNVTPAVSITGNAAICAGVSTTFTAAPINGGTPTYQWLLNGANVGTNSSTYTNVALLNGNIIQCVMTTSVSCPVTPTATSNTVTMSVTPTVSPAVTIAGNTSICAGTATTFTATPSNGGTPTYQWLLNGNSVGANSFTYSNGSLSNNDIVSCVMTTSATCPTTPTATSNALTMLVNPTLTPAVSIVANFSTVCSGNSVTFTATPTNGGTPSYQWLLNGINAGGNSNSYTNGLLLNNDIVSCVMTTTEACTTSPTSTSNTVAITVNDIPTVYAGTDQIICVGESVTLSGSGATSYTWNNSIIDGSPFNPSVGINTYIVTGTLNGCSNTDEVIVTVNTVENYSVNVIDPTASVTILNTATYQWIDCNNGNANIPGEVNTDFTPVANGNYAVVINQNGCTSTSSCVQITATGIVLNNDSYSVNVFPNPTHGEINISFEKGMNDVSFIIENVIGEIVYKSKSNQENGSLKTIDLSNFSKGVYFINVKNQNADLRYKIILQK